MSKLFYLAIIVLCVSCSQRDNGDLSLYTVKKDNLKINLTEEGELKATNSINISSPNISWRYGDLKIIKIIEDGTEVQKGDTVIVFDPSEVGKVIEQSKNELEIARAELEKQQAQQQSRLEELETSLKVTQINHQISKINFELAEYEAEVTKKEIELKLQKAEISLSKARDEIENTKKIQHEELQQTLLRIDQLKTKLQEGKDALNSLTVISPEPGIAIITRNYRTNNKWQVGDQTWPANPMITLPDMNEIMASVQINEIDISKILPNQAVEVRLDAYTDTIFNAKISKIANLAENKNNNTKIKVFPVEALIDGTSSKLLPGMTVSCKILIDEIQDKIVIPAEALFSEGIKHWVFKKSGGSFDKVEVKIGPSNNDFVIIEEGLEEKDEISMVDPTIAEEQKESES
ncbi:HlyD family efflux transporter periplasmic adaptor subunit [Puteibacter caeruleilacunae]|nr:HlyD family efflux transporter periplasmic adaptor subunit [Puteibacter caeruleilacunae]